MSDITPDGIKVIKGLEGFRKRPDMYIGAKPWGVKLSGSLIDELVQYGAVPSCVDKVKEWWIISAQKDWLSTAVDICLDPFEKFSPGPRGRNHIRAELLIAAYATVALTAGQNGLTWISEDKSQALLPTEIEQLIANIGSGRLVAFKIDGE